LRLPHWTTVYANTLNPDGIKAQVETRNDGPKGLGDFQRRSNRDRDNGWGGRNRRDNGRKGWEETPRTERGGRDRADGPSVRVPNVGWDSTPRNPGGESSRSGWGSAKNRQWDAPTPVANRGSRGGSPDDERGPAPLDAREWEEEQVRLDRDWYMSSEGGALDDEYNPLAQYDDSDIQKSAEIATKHVVCFVGLSSWLVHSILCN